MKRYIVTLSIFVVLGAGAYWYASGKGFSTVAQIAGVGAAGTTVGDSAAAASDNITGAVDYSDPDYHFKFSYPKDLNVHVYDEDGGGRTVTFESDTPGIGFQVFVVPYTDTTVTSERFKTDDPSGVMKEPQDIAIDGVPAKIFYGHNDQMGDTREVWFIHGGFLYEVTTYKSLDTWLTAILQTWKFI